MVHYTVLTQYYHLANKDLFGFGFMLKKLGI